MKAVTAKLAQQFSLEVDQLSRKHNIKRLLFDVRDVANIDTVLENYNFAYNEISELGLQSDVRYAILTDPADESHDFVGIVTRNAGYNVRLFVDKNAAIAWLEGQTSR